MAKMQMFDIQRVPQVLCSSALSINFQSDKRYERLLKLKPPLMLITSFEIACFPNNIVIDLEI